MMLPLLLSFLFLGSFYVSAEEKCDELWEKNITISPNETTLHISSSHGKSFTLVVHQSEVHVFMELPGSKGKRRLTLQLQLPSDFYNVEGVRARLFLSTQKYKLGMLDAAFSTYDTPGATGLKYDVRVPAAKERASVNGMVVLIAGGVQNVLQVQHGKEKRSYGLLVNTTIGGEVVAELSSRDETGECWHQGHLVGTLKNAAERKLEFSLGKRHGQWVCHHCSSWTNIGHTLLSIRMPPKRNKISCKAGHFPLTAEMFRNVGKEYETAEDSGRLQDTVRGNWSLFGDVAKNWTEDAGSADTVVVELEGAIDDTKRSLWLKLSRNKVEKLHLTVDRKGASSDNYGIMLRQSLDEDKSTHQPLRLQANYSPKNEDGEFKFLLKSESTGLPGTPHPWESIKLQVDSFVTDRYDLNQVVEAFDPISKHALNARVFQNGYYWELGETEARLYRLDNGTLKETEIARLDLDLDFAPGHFGSAKFWHETLMPEEKVATWNISSPNNLYKSLDDVREKIVRGIRLPPICWKLPHFPWGAGSVVDKKNFRAADEAKRLHDAMSGPGTDEVTVIGVLVGASNEQRQAIKKVYKEKYQQDLAQWIESATKGNSGKTLLALLLPRIEYEAQSLRDALRGGSEKEAVLTEVLVGRSPEDILALNAAYLKATEGQKSLLDDIDKHLRDGDFKDIIKRIIARPEHVPSAAEEEELENEAIKDGKALEGAFTSADARGYEKIVPVLTSKSYAYLSRVLTLANLDPANLTFSEALAGKFSRAAQDLLASIAKEAVDSSSFFAERLNLALENAGSLNPTIRILVTRSEQDLVDITRAYKLQYGEELSRRISRRLSNLPPGDNGNLVIKRIIGE